MGSHHDGGVTPLSHACLLVNMEVVFFLRVICVHHGTRQNRLRLDVHCFFSGGFLASWDGSCQTFTPTCNLFYFTVHRSPSLALLCVVKHYSQPPIFPLDHLLICLVLEAYTRYSIAYIIILYTYLQLCQYVTSSFQICSQQLVQSILSNLRKGSGIQLGFESKTF